MPRKGENIYKRKDGRWEGRYIKARSKTGKAVYGYVYAPTYKEAKRKRSQAIINIEANQTTICKVPETTMPTCFIRKLANDWMNSIQSQIKKSSYVKYYNILHTYILPEFDNVPLSELTSSRIQKFCDDLLTHGSSSGEGLSPKTVLDILSLVRSLLRYAQIQGYQPPSTGKEIIIRQTAPDTVVIPRSSQDILCRYLYANMSERNLGILLCLFTGMRVGDDDDKIRLNQRKPSKYKGLSRFGPEKNLQRINKFMKERPIFYKNLIQMKENFRFYLRCFYCITKVVILQFNSEKQDRISS